MNIRIDYELLTEGDARTYAVLWRTVQADFPDMPDDDIARIISLVVDTCPYCYEANRRCQCWNDE